MYPEKHPTIWSGRSLCLIYGTTFCHQAFQILRCFGLGGFHVLPTNDRSLSRLQVASWSKLGIVKLWEITLSTDSQYRRDFETHRFCSWLPNLMIQRLTEPTLVQPLSHGTPPQNVKITQHLLLAMKAYETSTCQSAAVKFLSKQSCCNKRQTYSSSI